MSTVTTDHTTNHPHGDHVVADRSRDRQTGFVNDTITIAGRALRAIPGDLEFIIPPVLIALFFFVVNLATFGNMAEGTVAGLDYTAFQMPTAILLGVTGVSRSGALVLDVQNGYLDRLLLTPVSRLSILFGHLAADVVVAIGLSIPILIVSLFLGAGFESGIVGVLVFIAFAAAWSVAFSGFGYAVALRTGNPAAVQSVFMLFFPFLFLTTSYVPREQLSGWLDTVAGFNPVTYLLEGMRSLSMSGWDAGDLVGAAIAVSVVGTISMFMCLSALRSRVAKG